MYIGWDWATETHDVTVMDNTGARVARWEFAHTEEGIVRTLETRQRADHVEARIAAVNQLAAILDMHWPGGKAVFSSLDSDIALAFLERYPTPASAAKLTAGRLEAWCKRHGYSGKRPGSVLIERLRSAPQPTSRLGESVIEQLVRVQVQLVKSIRTTIRALDTAIADAVSSHPYAPLLATMPRIGTINLGQIIGEIGPILERSRTSEQFIAETGVVPVTRASGKSRVVTFRYAANRRARLAIVAYADNSRHASDWASKIYNDARADRKRHPHAARILPRSWLCVMWACWRDGTCYDPDTHRANNKIKTDPEETLAA